MRHAADDASPCPNVCPESVTRICGMNPWERRDTAKYVRAFIGATIDSSENFPYINKHMEARQHGRKYDDEEKTRGKGKTLLLETQTNVLHPDFLNVGSGRLRKAEEEGIEQVVEIFVHGAGCHKVRGLDGYSKGFLSVPGGMVRVAGEPASRSGEGESD